MGKKSEKKLSKLKKAIRELEGDVITSEDIDSSFILRIFREELDEESISVAVLSRTYPREELSIAKRVARILTKAEVNPKEEDSDAELTAAEELLLVKARNLYGQGHEDSSSKEKLKKARKILKDLGIKKASVLADGKLMHITADKSEIVKIAGSLSKIRKKMRALGFSDVLLNLSS